MTGLKRQYPLLITLKRKFARVKQTTFASGMPLTNEAFYKTNSKLFPANLNRLKNKAKRCLFRIGINYIYLPFFCHFFNDEKILLLNLPLE